MVATTDFALPPVDTGLVLTKTAGASAISQLVTSIPLSGTGNVFHTFSSGDPEYVTESGLKPVVATNARTLELHPAKFAKVVILTTELSEDAREISQAIYTEIPTAFATIVDKIVIGDRPKPSADFDSLVGAQSLTLDTVADLYTAVDTVEATGVSVDGILFTSSMLNHLRSKVNQLGAPVFTIVGNEINGIPFAVVKSATKVAYMGPFGTRAVTGTVANYPRIDVALDTAEVNGVVRVLKQHNEFGIIAETRVAFRIADIAEWVKLVPYSGGGTASGTGYPEGPTSDAPTA